MFELTVEREFCAAHALSVGGQRETMHGHNWHVTVCIEGETLDSDGLLCDFHTVEEVLDEVILPLRNADLHGIEPFTRVNPTAENMARHIAESLAAVLDASLAPAARVAWVSVTEAPGCTARYRCPAR